MVLGLPHPLTPLPGDMDRSTRSSWAVEALFLAHSPGPVCELVRLLHVGTGEGEKTYILPFRMRLTFSSSSASLSFWGEGISIHRVERVLDRATHGRTAHRYSRDGRIRTRLVEPHAAGAGRFLSRTPRLLSPVHVWVSVWSLPGKWEVAQTCNSGTHGWIVTADADPPATSSSTAGRRVEVGWDGM